MHSAFVRDPGRRLTAIVLATLLSAAILLARADRAFALNPIQAENQLPGTTNWQVSTPPNQAIEGYATQLSLQAGQTLQLHVSTIPAAMYRVEIYRLGYYQGLGGRLITCIPSCSGSKQGTDYPVNTSTGYLGAGWPVTDTTTVDPTWTTGYYEAKFVLTSGSNAGGANYYPFVVRAPPGENAPILVQASVNTWEAYNNWGGKSLYAFNTPDHVPATQVSFERPYSYLSKNSGPFSWEYSLARWLEKNGYDVSYQTDIDSDENPSSLLGRRLDVMNGHDEYLSHAERLAFDTAVSNGVNLAAIGGNISVWQTRYANNHTTLLEYRTASADPDPDPTQKTVRFSELATPMPECQLLGIGFSGGAKGSDPPSFDFAVTRTATTNSSWFAGTGLTSGSTIFDSIGYEWDTIQPGCNVPPVTDLLHFSGSTSSSGGPDGGGSNVPADAVTYTAQSGARVFSSGSLQLVWALDDTLHSRPAHVDPRVQALFANIFNSLGAGAPLTPGQPVQQQPTISQVAVRRVRGKLRFAATLSQSAEVMISASRLVGGRVVHGRCTVGTRRGRRCHTLKRWLLRHRQLHAGLDRFRLSMRPLPPGSYLVALTAIGTGGASNSSTVWVTIVHRF